MRLSALLLALAALVLFTPMANAQPSDLSGRWTVTTAPHPNSGCIITGTADFSRNDGGYRVMMSVEQRCGADDPEPTEARESCTATQGSSGVQIFCELLYSSSDGYVPDNFFLPTISRGRMDGRLDDYNAWDVPVRFTRGGDDALVS